MRINPVLLIDFYKSGHIFQYVDKTELVFSNLTARMSRINGVDKIIFFGLQYYIQEYLINMWRDEFFDRPWRIIEAEYQHHMDNALGEGVVTTHHLRALHSLGYLPIKIMALPEGSAVPLRVPCMVMYNTLPEFFWLTNYLETSLSAVIWGACTSATMANEYAKILNHYADETVGRRDFVPYQGHDFSMRGMLGIEAGMISGAGHLTGFVGTDSVPAIDLCEEYYNDNTLVGCSVPATEHSVMCLGEEHDEIGTFKNLICNVYPRGIVSIVSDTWDFWKVITEYVPALKNEILLRDGKLVIRPDSGDPADIICGTARIHSKFPDYVMTIDDLKVYATDMLYEEVAEETDHGECGDAYRTGYFAFKGNVWEIKIELEWNRYDKQYYYIDGCDLFSCEIAKLTPEQKGAIECLYETFGGTRTEKGYTELDSHIGLIYGDSITLDRCRDICKRLEAKGFASTNVVFGIGSFTYQYTTRDTYGFAVKATYAEVDGEPREIFKKPKTDDGMKTSAKGLTAVFRNSNGDFILKDQANWHDVNNCELRTVFEDGIMKYKHTLSEIRDNIKENNETHTKQE
jgi:nicotinamide phosphoribosyltransferase